MSIPGRKRAFGVRQTSEPEPLRFSRPEGTQKPIAQTSTHGPKGSGRSISPDRYEKRNMP